MSIDVLQSTNIPAGTWTIDPSHSEVGFTARHLMSKVRGQFEKFEGQIVTGDAPLRDRDDRPQLGQHPRGEPRRAPALRRLLRRGEQRPDDLHLHHVRAGRQGSAGHRRPDAQGRHQAGHARRRGPRLRDRPLGRHPRRLRGHHEISRKEFGVDFKIPMDGGRLLVGDKINVIIAVQAILEQDEPPLTAAPARSCERPPVPREPGAVARRYARSRVSQLALSA